MNHSRKGLGSILKTEPKSAMTQDRGNGFRDHGVAVAVSSARGIVATVDGDNRKVVLVWLLDSRGGYALLVVDAETGKSDQIPMPFPPAGDSPFSSLLSSGNRFYTHFSSHFVEFDVAKRAFTFVHETAPRVAMGMTEDDDGRIWAATYPDSGVLSFDPRTREFRDYGHVHKENWMQYQRSIAADDTGWIYFAVGNTASQIISLDPVTGHAEPVLPDAERIRDTAYVYRDVNGKVYGHPGNNTDWRELYRGKATLVGTLDQAQPKPFVTGHQGLFHREFPDGERVQTCNLTERVLTIEQPATSTERTVHFDYTSEGAHAMGLAATPDGGLCGGTAFPMCSFRYDPEADSTTYRPCHGQWNCVTRQGDRFFIGGYTQGFLLEWDPAQPWVATEKRKAESNPLFLTECESTINRPHALLAHPDGKTLIMAGTPGYGHTGGGLLFWDRATRTRTLLEHTDLLPQHSTMSMVALPNGELLGGTGTRAGSGGEVRATEAELYLLDMATKTITWHHAVYPGAQEYSDMCLGPDGLVFGLVTFNAYDPGNMDDGKRFFVFDPVRKAILYDEDTERTFGSVCLQQGQRKLIVSPEGRAYVLFRKGIARIDPATFKLSWAAQSPVTVDAGGEWLNGRIYFASKSRLYSWGEEEAV